MRKVRFATGEYYHIFNHGVDKRDIFTDQKDLERFFQSMFEFNTPIPVGGIYAASFRKNDLLRNSVSKSERLIDFICYCLNPNHFHFMVHQLVDRGIEKLMHRLGLGYSKYFNKKHERSGSLFQGPFKAVHVDSDAYLLHLSAYINLNNRVHGLNNVFYKSSWDEFINTTEKVDSGFCNKEIVLGQFKNINSYKNFADESLEDIRKRKKMEKLLLE